MLPQSDGREPYDKAPGKGPMPGAMTRGRSREERADPADNVSPVRRGCGSRGLTRR